MPKKEKNDSIFLESVEKKFGRFIIDREEILKRPVDAIPTGSLSLDFAIGVGGIPRGKYTEIYGEEGSAKTSLCLSIAKKAIQLALKVLYIDMENSLDYKYINLMVGEFNEDNFRLIQPKTAEQALYVAEMGIQSKEFELIILDSVGALAPADEQEDDYDKAHVAIVPRKMAAFLRRNSYDLRDNNIAFIFVNQVRDTIGGYHAALGTPGGRALKHFTALRIQLRKTEFIKVGPKKEEQIIGIYSTFTTKKNKMSAPFKTHMFPLVFGQGIDTEMDTVEFAEMLGILKLRGSYYVLEGGGGETLAQGKAKMIQLLKSDKELLDKITKLVYNVSTPEILEDLSEAEEGEEINEQELEGEADLFIRSVPEY